MPLTQLKENILNLKFQYTLTAILAYLFFEPGYVILAMRTQRFKFS